VLASGEPLALWQYQQSAELETIGDAARRSQRLEAGVTPFDAVENAARASIPVLKRLRHSAQACLSAWQALEAAFDSYAEAPPMGRLRDLLEEIVSVADRYAGSETVEVEVETGETDGAAEGRPSVGTVAASGRVSTREEAFRVLEEIADFFRRTEPHSPLAYTLREAVRRGRLTWSELLEEIVPDNDSRAAILSSLGIRPPPPPE
jgi:type VI secretion system protein ImpA